MVKECFAACEQQFPEQRSELRRISLALRRNGVEEMEQLCRLISQTPQELLRIRSIGEKRLWLIAQVCRQYQRTIEQEE